MTRTRPSIRPEPRATIFLHNGKPFTRVQPRKKPYQPTIVVRKGNQDVLMISLGKDVSPGSVETKMNSSEMGQVKRDLFHTLDRLTKELGKRKASNRYPIVSRRTNRLAQYKNGGIIEKSAKFEVPVGLRIRIPRSATPIVRSLDEVAYHARRNRDQTAWHFVFKIQGLFGKMFQSLDSRYQVFPVGRTASTRTNIAENELIQYLDGKAILFRKPEYIGAVLASLNHPIKALAILRKVTRGRGKNEAWIKAAEEQIRKGKKARNVPLPKTLEWYVRSRRNNDPRIAEYDFFPRKEPNAPKVPF